MSIKQKPLSILQFCNKPPYPPLDGGAIGMHNVTQGLLDAGNQVKVLMFNTSKYAVDLSKLPREYLAQTKVEAVSINLSINPWAAFVNLFYTKRSFNISRFDVRAMRQKLRSILQSQSFDIIQVESIFLKDYLPLIRCYSNAKVILRAPNVEFVIWQRLAEIESNPLKRFYLRVLAKRLRKEEISCLNQFDAIYSVTEIDMQLLKSLGATVPLTFIPTGIDVTKNLTTKESSIEFPSLFHLGALDWYPNQEAVKWLLEKVWPSLHRQFPQLKFYIAGRRPPKWLSELKVEGVEIIGEVKDAAAFIKSKAIMPVPLFSGSGMRVKIIEAMMLQKAVVSTDIGIEGIIHHPEKDVLIANTPAEFIRQLSRLIQDKALFKTISLEAQQTAMLHYSNEKLTDKLIDFLQAVRKL